MLDLGDGKPESHSMGEDNEASWVKIPDDLLIPKGDNPMEEIINSTYPNLLSNYSDPFYVQDKPF